MARARYRPVHRPLCPDGSGAAGRESPAPCAEAARPFVLAATILGSAMAFIDGTVVHIALPAIQADFGAGFGEIQWVVNAYALMLGALILVGGGLGDRLGRRRVFAAGIGLFALSSLACAAAPDAATLIAARAAQGVGAALLVPQSLAIIAAAFPRAVRGRAIGLWAGASAVTTAFGPPLGGALIDLLDWRWAFWINLPLSVVALWLTAIHVPESRDEAARGPLDWRGAAMAVIGFGALTFGLTRLGDGAGAAPAVSLGLGAAGLAAFVAVERRAVNPLTPPSLFQSDAFTAANVMTVLLYAAFGATLFLLPFELIERRGLSASTVGLTLLPIGIVIGVLSRLTGAASERYGARAFLATGSAVVAAAIAVLAIGALEIGVESYWAGVLAPILMMSLGMGLVVAPLTTVVMNAAPDAQAGAASGVNNAASRLAGLFAVAICGSLASIVFAGALDLGIAADAPSLTSAPRFGALPEPTAPERATLEAAFRTAYAAAMGLAAALAAAASLVAFCAIPDRDRVTQST